MTESKPDPSLEARSAPLDDTENVVASQASQQTETYVPDRAAAKSEHIGGHIGDYEILAEIARGGMGVVYKARHVRLGSLAAVKLIRSGEFAGEHEIQRFHTEARAAAQLSHPGIVSVHQVGEHAGQHFLAMAYVDGQSLWQRVKEAPLEPKLAAKLMQQVAEAIQYAHDKGIIHRDLKPQNILLETTHQGGSGPQPSTLDPQPKVTDFGLAKNQAGDSSLTASGDVLGTPSYMPPEQATGKLAQVGPLADVYSLGATLYCLLTGRPPFQAANSLETLLQVVEQEPVPPRQLNRSVPDDLETICLKCLEKDPAKRYASAKTLADDLGRFQRDEPILARPVSRAEHAWRWCKRNPVVAGLSTSAVILLISVATVSTLAYFREAKLVSEKDVLIEEKDKLIVEKDDLARKETASAESAREQSQLALETLSSVIFDLQGSLKKLPGGAPVRQRLLATALEKLDQISTEFVEQSSVDRQSAAAFIEIADTILQLGSANDPGLTSGENGPVQTAMKLYSRAHEINKKLASLDPNDSNAQRDLAVSHDGLGKVQLQSGKIAVALQSYQQSLEIRQRRAAADPGDSEAQRDLAVSYDRLGDVQLQSGQVAAAFQSLQKFLEIAQRRAAADPDDRQAQQDLAVSLGKLGKVQLRSGQVVEALQSLQQSLKIRQRRAAIDPDDSEAQRDLAVSHDGLGDLQLRSGQVAEALQSFQQSLEIRERLVAADPDDSDAHRALAMSHDGLGVVQLRSGQVAEALQTFQQSLEIRQRRVAADPDDSDAQRDLAMSHDGLGDVQLRSGQVAEALQTFQQSLEIRQRRVAADPDDSEAQRDLALSHDKLGKVQLHSGLVADALQSYQQSLEIRQRRAAADPDDSQAKRDLGVSHDRLGNVQLQLGQVADALRSFQQCLEIAQRRAAVDPDDSQAQQDLAVSHGKLGEVQVRSGQVGDALQSYQQSLEIRQRRAAADPDDDEVQRDLAISYSKVGDVQVQSAQVSEALRSYQQSLEITQRLATADPDDSQAQRNLFVSYYKLGEVTIQTHEFDAAGSHFLAGITVLEQMIERGLAVDRSKQELLLLKQRLAYSNSAKHALGDWDELLKADPKLMPELLFLRATDLQEKGNIPGVLQAADKLRELDPKNKDNLYNSACLYARCAAAVTKDKPEPSAEELAERKKYLDQSLAALKESLAVGWDDFDHIQKDADLEPLRELPEFQAMMEEAKKVKE